MFSALMSLLQTKKTSFPTKQGVNAVSCVGLLDLHGALFCLDNQNILFKEKNELKVLKPVMKRESSKERKDFDVFRKDDYFAIPYKGGDYYYMADYEETTIRGNTYIKLKDIKQEVYPTDVVDSCIIVKDNL